MATIKVVAETQNKTMVFGDVRLRPGVNEISEETIRKNGIDKLPFVVMPEDWVSEKPKLKTFAKAPKIEIVEDKPEAFVANNEEDDTVGENVLGEAMRQEKEKVDSTLLSPGHISVMEVGRAKEAIKKVTSVPKLVEAYQMSNKKTVKEAIKRRIAELDSDNPFGKE